MAPSFLCDLLLHSSDELQLKYMKQLEIRRQLHGAISLKFRHLIVDNGIKLN